MGVVWERVWRSVKHTWLLHHVLVPVYMWVRETVDTAICPRMRALQQILNEVKPPTTRLAGIEFLEKLTGIAAKADGRDRYVFGVDLDEVYPGVFVGDEGAARNVEYLKYLGITHVLNAAEGVGFGQVSTSGEFYRPHGLHYMGLMLEDVAHTDMISRFEPAADFIEGALENNGKVLVHCLMGMSRSATLSVGFLMLRRGMTVEQALTTVREHRCVRPNNGFLHQLIQLDNRIREDLAARHSGEHPHHLQQPAQSHQPLQHPQQLPQQRLHGGGGQLQIQQPLQQQPRQDESAQQHRSPQRGSLPQ